MDKRTDGADQYRICGNVSKSPKIECLVQRKAVGGDTIMNHAELRLCHAVSPKFVENIITDANEMIRLMEPENKSMASEVGCVQMNYKGTFRDPCCGRQPLRWSTAISMYQRDVVVANEVQRFSDRTRITERVK